MKTENIHVIYSVNHTRKYLKLSKFTCKHILYLIEKKFQESLSGDHRDIFINLQLISYMLS